MGAKSSLPLLLLLLVVGLVSKSLGFSWHPTAAPRSCLHQRPPHAVRLSAAPLQEIPSTTATTAFDGQKAVRLAAFSFATYGDPSGSRWMRMPDGTLLGFQSDALVRRNFRALLLVHILKARNLPEERGGLLEKALSGSSCDPYIISSVNNSCGADLAITRAKDKDRNPDFYQRFFLYVEDPATAVLELTIKDKNLLKGDDVIGHCRVPVSTLPEDMEEWSGTLEIESTHADQKGGRAGTVEMELQLVPLDDADEEDGADDEGKEGSPAEDKPGDLDVTVVGPKSVLEGIDWNVLGARVGGAATGLGRYQFASFLTNEDTDTQAAIWFDAKAKEIIVSFRGTQMEWKDLLTDMYVFQEGLDGPTDSRLVHAGFKRAFKSVCGAVLQALTFIAPNLLDEGWNVDVCGHSLGGALACLMAHELDRRIPGLVQADRLYVYSFGAPRVGNTAFCKDYDARLKDCTFRIVNGLDVVARMPRGTRQTAALLEYSHCGRTVLLTETDAGAFKVWVEGESEGTCPLRESDPFAVVPVPDASTTVEGKKPAALEFQMPISVATFDNGTVASVQEMLRAAGNLTNLQAMLTSFSSPSSSLGPFGKLSLEADMNQIAQALFGSALNSTAVIGKSMGLNATFVESELNLIKSLLGGDALAHHMEPLYYVALEKAFAEMAAAEAGGEGEARTNV